MLFSVDPQLTNYPQVKIKITRTTISFIELCDDKLIRMWQLIGESLKCMTSPEELHKAYLLVRKSIHDESSQRRIKKK